MFIGLALFDTSKNQRWRVFLIFFKSFRIETKSEKWLAISAWHLRFFHIFELNEYTSSSHQLSTKEVRVKHYFTDAGDASLSYYICLHGSNSQKTTCVEISHAKVLNRCFQKYENVELCSKDCSLFRISNFWLFWSKIGLFITPMVEYFWYSQQRGLSVFWRSILNLRYALRILNPRLEISHKKR